MASSRTALAVQRRRAQASKWRPSFMSVVMAIIAILTFSAVFSSGASAGGMGVAASTDKRSEYGTVIGIDLGTT